MEKLIKKQTALSLYLLLGTGVLAAFWLSLKTGVFNFSLPEAVRDIAAGRTSTAAVLLWEVRFPRAVLGLLTGATLGLSGAALQGYLRNPLAEPAILGVTGGAVTGAVLMLYTGLSAAFALALPLGALAGALVSVWVLLLLSGFLPGTLGLVLAGVSLNTLTLAGTALFLNLSPNPYAALEIVFWQMGSLADRSLDHVVLVLPFVAAGWALLLWDGRALNALSLGEDAAASLGVKLSSVRLRLVLGTALSVGAVVSVCGSIGFVGLIVPHLMRPFVSHEPGRLLVPSALAGAILILLADVCVRVLPSGAELKIGVLTAILGAPFFLALIFSLRREVR